MAELFSTSRTAQILDVSTNTLKRWYKWYNSKDFEKPEGLVLPQPTLDTRNTMFFNIEQIQQLQAFHEKLQNEYRGCMAEFNALYQWGQRGISCVGKHYKKKKEENNE